MKFQVAVANKEIAQVEKRLKKWTVFKKYFPRYFSMRWLVFSEFLRNDTSLVIEKFCT